MINSSIYIFGSLNSGYTQYPNNYSKEIYQKIISHSIYKSQMAIHRDNDLMYYAYVRKLDKDAQYIGFCVLINSMMFSNISSLFTIFENVFADIVSKGKLLALDDNGDVIAVSFDFANNQQEVDYVISMVQNGIDGLEDNMVDLPPVNYSISNSEKKYFYFNDKSKDIVDSSCKYAYTFISKEKGCNTSSLLGYKGVIKKLHKEKNEILERYDNLQNKFDKLNKQKKQYRNVVILCIVVVLCGFGLYFLKDSLDNTQQSLQHEQTENENKSKVIKSLNSKIANLNTAIQNLETSLSYEKSKREEAETELNGLTEVYKNQQPLFIKNTSFSFNTGYLDFDYYGYFDKNITLTVKAFDGNSSYSYSTNFLVEKGHHSGSIYLSSHLSGSRWYSFELLIGNKIIGGDRH